MSNRPYFSRSIVQLEEEFERHRTSLSVVQDLHAELGHRSTERARRLRAKIDDFLRQRKAVLKLLPQIPPLRVARMRAMQLQHETIQISVLT